MFVMPVYLCNFVVLFKLDYSCKDNLKKVSVVKSRKVKKVSVLREESSE